MTYREWEKQFVVQKSKSRKNNKINLNKVVSTANQIVNSSVQQKEHKESKLTYDEEFEEFIVECERKIAKYHENKD